MSKGLEIRTHFIYGFEVGSFPKFELLFGSNGFHSPFLHFNSFTFVLKFLPDGCELGSEVFSIKVFCGLLGEVGLLG
jgi:hypothetical protein